MTDPKTKWRAVDAWMCAECDHVHKQGEWSSAPNPFDPDQNAEPIVGCVNCYAVNSLMLLCDAEGCLLTPSCRTSFSDGQCRRTCRGHSWDV